MTDNTWVLEGLKLVKPETALVASILLVILADLTRFKKVAAFFTIAGLVFGAWLTGQLLWPEAPDGTRLSDPIREMAFQKAYAVDGFANYFKLMFLATSLIVTI